jgi:hypothetical protein
VNGELHPVPHCGVLQAVQVLHSGLVAGKLDTANFLIHLIIHDKENGRGVEDRASLLFPFRGWIL